MKISQVQNDNREKVKKIGEAKDEAGVDRSEKAATPQGVGASKKSKNSKE